MIEDINERMTQFAPSQNNPLNDDPIAEEIAIARQVTPQPDAATIDVDPIAEEIAQSRRDLMMATFGSAAEANPDQAAQAKKLGEQFGVGADIAGRNMQQLKKQALLDELERRDLMRRDPILARYLSNHDFAAMAHDDIDNLAKTEDLFQGSWFARYEDPIAYGKKTISMIDERFRRGRAIVEMGRANDLLGLRAQWSPDPRKASEISEELKKLTTEGGIVGAGVEVVGQMLDGIPEVAETTAMGATAGGAVGAVGGPAGFVTIPAGMLTGAGAGFAAGSARSAFMAESGNSYQQMIEQGYDPEVARKAAIGVGVVNASIEMISFGALGPVLRRLGVNVFRPAVANALAKPTAAKALATLGGDYAKAVAAGASEEFLQEIATGIGDDIARVYGSSSPSRILDEGGITDLLGTALESGVQGAMGMAILGGIGPVANFRYDMRRAGAAERQQAFFERLSANAVDSKLRGRDMNAFERFVASQAEGTEAETIFVDAAAMQGVLRQSNLSDEQIDEALPGVREQLQAAAQTGGDVTLPTAAFAARVAGTDLGNAMLPHVRLAPDAMSVTEAQEFQKNRDQLVEQARVIMEEKGRADDAFVQEARAIEDRIYQEVVATGTMDENAARANATFVRDLYVTMAARMNTTPAALEQRFPYRVESQGVAITEPLEQAEQFDQAGERRTDTPEFKAWSGNAPIVQGAATEFATGQPFVAVAYHGSPVPNIAAFDPSRPSRFMGHRQMGAIWFGAEPATATNFAEWGSIYPAYVTLKNPLVVDAAKEAQPDLYVRLPGGQTVYDINYIKSAAVDRAKRDGHDGVVFVNAYDGAPVGGNATIYAIFNPIDIKSVNNRGTWSRATANIMQQAATMDAKYMAAVERGDMATAQRMVDEAAERAMPNSLVRTTTFKYGEPDAAGRQKLIETTGSLAVKYHGGKAGITQFTGVERRESAYGKMGKLSLHNQGIWLANNPGTLGEPGTSGEAAAYANNYLPDAQVYPLFVNITNPKRLGIEQALDYTVQELKAQGHDGAYIIDTGAWIAFSPEQVKLADSVVRDAQGNIIPLSRRFDITSPRIFEQAAVPAAIDAQHREAIKAGDIATAQALTDAVAETRMPDSQVRNEAGKILRVFHGTQRIDRVGNRLLKKRATSGPMPFFTNTRPIAEGYAQGKQDTSIEDIGYEQWVKYTPKGQRSKVTLDQAWFYLTPEQKATATERIFTTGYENPDEGTGAIVGNTDTIASRDHVAYLLREARGNALTAAKELWLNSGSLFNEEQQFMDVLKGMGLTERFVYDSPHAVNSGIIEAYLNITNPLDTAAIPASVVEALQRRADRSRRPAAQYGRDFWDKETRNPQEWMATLRSDIAEGKTQAWTSIPDWVTDVLRGLGYDGIKDTGGKFGGEQHTVWIPFEPKQVKFANAITKDASGRLIPLSERFDLTSPMMYRQAAAGPARGGFDPSRLTTILNKNADLSTFIHETAHFYLTILGNLAADPAATPEIRADMDTLLKWFGIAGDTEAARLAAWNAMSVDQQRKYHEQFAYSFEIYMFEGKSPSAEMQGLFDRFSAWLKRVYRSIRDDLNAIYRREFGEDLPLLTGEVRQVMDRMLASEEQIKRQAAINEMKPMFQTQEQSGMDDAEWAAYQQMQQEAVEAAVTDMNKASLRQMQWLSNARARILRDLQAKHAKQRKEIREEVAEEIRRQPLYRAMEYLRTGTFTDADGEAVKMEGAHRLDMESVRQMYELEPENLRPDIAKLGTGGRGMMGMNGIDPDVAAELFGFSSGDELIRALIEAQPMKEAIDARTDELMLERFSELSTPEGREAKVQESLHNEARARFVAVELRFVAKATQPARVLVEAAKQAAREMIAGKRIADLRPSEFIAAEARAARAAGKIGKPVNVDAVAQAAYTRAKNEALASGAPEDVAEAGAVVARDAARAAAQARLDEQRAQYGADPAQALIRAKRAQLYQNQLAAEALAARDEVEKGVRYLRQVMRDSNVKRMGADVADQIDRILERFNLRPMSAKRMAERQSLVQWLESLKESGLEPDLAPEILDEAARKPYREMTVAEFRDLVDAVKQLEYIGKNAQKIKRAQEMAEFEEVRDEIVASVRGNFTGKETKPRSATTAMGKRLAKAKRFLYSHLKAAAIARIMDGGKDDGPVWNFLIRTANEAGDMETRMRAEATKRLTEILAPVFALGKMGGKGIYFETVGMSLNREARLVIALNMGNDGNRQRLLDGEGWTLEQVQPILESLTEAEWKAVQDVWDYMESFRPLVGAKERRLYGREPKWVTPVPFTVRTADGKEVRLSGGYYPIKYDPVATERADTADEAEKARTELRGAYTAATTRRSFTKERAAKVEDMPLLYTMTGVYSGINDVIHDLAWHEWLIQANRLMNDKMFDRAVRETYGFEFKSQLKGWIKDVAAGERGAEDAADLFASYLRQNISAAGLGFLALSAILQVTGFSQSIVRVGAKHIARGVAVTTASPVQTMKFVNEKSSFMQERARTQFRELNELRNMVGDESAAQRRLRLGTYFLMMRMQRMVDVPTWVGAYEKALEAGKDDATAVALADQAVIDSQGSGMLKDLSKIERGGALSKLFTVFYSYMNTVYNMAAVSTMTPRSRGRLAADYAMLFIVPVVLNYALKKALTPDVDDEEPDMEKIATDLVAEELSFLMGTMVGVREFQNAANAVVGKETAARGYEGPAGLRAIGEAGRFAVQAKQLEFDRAFRRSAINMLGIGLGLPSAQINRTIDGIEALAEGETENPFAVMTGVQR